MKKNFLEILEKQEIIELLEKRGFAKAIDALLTNENKVYTKKGRLNKSGACRVLGLKPKELDEFLAKCREAISAHEFLEN